MSIATRDVINADMVEIEKNLEFFYAAHRENMLRLVFRDFIEFMRLKPSAALSMEGFPLFKSVLAYNIKDSRLSEQFPELQNANNIGDIPISVLIKIPDIDLLKYRQVGSEAIKVLRSLLAENSVVWPTNNLKS